MVGKRLGDPTTSQHYALRDYAASLIKLLCRRFGESSHTLRPRLTRACLKHFLDPTKPLGTHYGAIVGLAAIGGRECVRRLILPNIKLYEQVLKPELEEDSGQRRDAGMVVEAIFNVLKLLEGDEADIPNRMQDNENMTEEVKVALVDKLGDVVAERVWKEGKSGMVQAILDTRMTA
jgi:transcription initiation factor TFIID subunit 6